MGQDIFERKIDQTYENCKGAVGIADDVQVFVNEETQDRNVPGGNRMYGKQAVGIVMIKCIIKTKCLVSLVTKTLQKCLRWKPSNRCSQPINKRTTELLLGMANHLFIIC